MAWPNFFSPLRAVTAGPRDIERDPCNRCVIDDEGSPTYRELHGKCQKAVAAQSNA
jgi:hypothetical protein